MSLAAAAADPSTETKSTAMPGLPAQPLAVKAVDSHHLYDLEAASFVSALEEQQAKEEEEVQVAADAADAAAAPPANGAPNASSSSSPPRKAIASRKTPKPTPTVSALHRLVPIGGDANDPFLFVIDGLLSADDCAEIVRLGRRLKPEHQASAKQSYDFGKTHFFKCHPPAARRAYARIRTLIFEACEAARRRTDRGVAAMVPLLELNRYSPGQFFGTHFDVGDLTVLVYLTTEGDGQSGGGIGRGGGTFFPDAKVPAATALPEGVERRAGGGVVVHPRVGRAAVWFSKKADGGVDFRSAHCSEPVTAGEKWVLLQNFELRRQCCRYGCLYWCCCCCCCASCCGF